VNISQPKLRSEKLDDDDDDVMMMIIIIIINLLELEKYDLEMNNICECKYKYVHNISIV